MYKIMNKITLKPGLTLICVVLKILFILIWFKNALSLATYCLSIEVSFACGRKEVLA